MAQGPVSAIYVMYRTRGTPGTCTQGFGVFLEHAIFRKLTQARASSCKLMMQTTLAKYFANLARARARERSRELAGRTLKCAIAPNPSNLETTFGVEDERNPT